MKPRVLRSLRDLRAAVARIRRPMGFVPTMGALHAGHGSLISEARSESESVLVSIFVNPIQFNQQSDYERYPRPLEADLEFCKRHGVDLVFAPPLEEMYPRPQRTYVEVTGISDYLCGAFRPGHFRGVATVVLKLFNMVQPDRAYFGEKDAQQVAVIRRMVQDLNLPVTIVEVPTVREPDGLALSSRNVHLNPEERCTATVLYRALITARERISAGATDAGEVKREASAVFSAHPEVRVEYFEVVDPVEMQPVKNIAGPVRVAGAIWVGNTRLIDNLLCEHE